MIRGDLAAAGVPYVVEGPDGPEYADFHALRHSFVTALAAAGVGPKELQTLARHSDPRLTLGVYTHSSPERLAEAVGRVALRGVGGPAVPAVGPREFEAMAGLFLAVAGVLVLFGPAGVRNGVRREIGPTQPPAARGTCENQSRV
jgi:hypothetical protein